MIDRGKMESFTVHASKDGNWVETENTTPDVL